jgi:hypothetical protein
MTELQQIYEQYVKVWSDLHDMLDPNERYKLLKKYNELANKLYLAKFSYSDNNNRDVCASILRNIIG